MTVTTEVPDLFTLDWINEQNFDCYSLDCIEQAQEWKKEFGSHVEVYHKLLATDPDNDWEDYCLIVRLHGEAVFILPVANEYLNVYDNEVRNWVQSVMSYESSRG